MNRRIVLIAAALLGGCASTPNEGPRRVGDSDSAAEEETDVPVDTDLPDTDLPDTDLPDTDLPDASDVPLEELLVRAFRDLRGDTGVLGVWIQALLDREVAARPSSGGEAWSVALDVRLDPDVLGGATAPAGTDPADQVAAAGFDVSATAFAALRSAVLESNQVCIASSSTIYHRRTFSGACTPLAFASGTCDLLAATAEVHRKLSILGAAWLDLHEEFRALTLPGGARGVVARSWQDAVVDGYGGGAFRQEFTVRVWVEDGAQTRRVSAQWVELDLGLAGAALERVLADGLLAALERQDAFVEDPSAASCSEHRDSAYTRLADEA